VRWVNYLPRASSWAWCNPPYSRNETGRDLLGWVQCAARQDGVGVVMLLPPSMGSAYMELAWTTADEIRFFRGRLAFIHPDTGEPEHNGRGGSCLVVWYPERRRRGGDPPLATYEDAPR